jgi:hypothetical protein
MLLSEFNGAKFSVLTKIIYRGIINSVLEVNFRTGIIALINKNEVNYIHFSDINFNNIKN